MAKVRRALWLWCLVSGCAHVPTDRPYVASLQLRGVHAVPAKDLKQGLASQPSHNTDVGIFEDIELERDRVRVQRFYETQGYFAAKVVRAEAKPRPRSRAVDVYIAVEEGPPTLIGLVQVFGIDGLDDDTRNRVQQHQLGLRRGQVFRHADYLHFKTSLTREVQKNYPDATVESVVDISAEKNLASIVLTFHAPRAGEPTETSDEN